MSLPGPATDLQLSPRGDLLGAAWEGGARVARREGGGDAVTIEADAPVAALAFSPDGSRVALGCEDGTLRIAGAATGDEETRSTSEYGGLLTVAWSPDGDLVAATHFEPWVGIFDAATGERLLLLDPDVFDDEGRPSAAVLPDGRVLSTARDNLVVWTIGDPRSGKKPRRKRVPAGGHVHLIDLDVAGDRALGLSQLESRSALHVWELADAPGKPSTVEVSGRCRRARWLPGGTSAAVAHDEGVTAWDVTAGRAADTRFEVPGGYGVTCLAVSAEPPVLYAGTDSGEVVAWDPTSGAPA
jgi:WD40 repeat protein